jgi:hypothetical protein
MIGGLHSARGDGRLAGRVCLGLLGAMASGLLPAGAAQVEAPRRVIVQSKAGQAFAADAPAEQAPARAKVPGRLEARCCDGSVVLLTLLDAKIPLKTDYGVLEVPVVDIERIDFATRVPEATKQKVAAAIGNLGSADFKNREQATAALLELGAYAYPALLSAVESDDPEVVLRADKLIEQLRKTIPEADLAVYEFDVIFTAKSQFGGTIEVDSIKVDTAAFGQQQVPIAVLRSLGSGSREQEPANVLLDPGNMANYQGQVGKTFYFRLTGPLPGRTQGAVWGNDIYTFDSIVSSAAVHAGVLRPGETKVVGVTMLGAQQQFVSSSRNGIVSGNWGQYPSAYKFVTQNPAARNQRPPR